MKQRLTQIAVLAGMFALLTAVVGCHSADQSASGPSVAPGQAAPAPANDARIPPEKRAALQNTMLQQQAGAQQMGERMKAAAQHPAAH